MVRRVHDASCPDEPVWQRDVIGELRATCADRHRRRGTLPTRLVDQIDGYLTPPSAVRRLVHGDLHEAYGWTVRVDFAARAMTMTLLHEFNPAGGQLPPLDHIANLDDLAATLWQL
jgi:hypothetical protein